MKGMVFVELMQMAEATLGEEVVDDILDSLELASGGAYNSVGNYPCSELMTIVGAFSAHTGASAADLQRMFRRWMHGRFVTSYPAFFMDKPDALSMFEAIENEVHVEVRKLYPEVELPTFDTERLAADRLRMTYRSPRPLSDFCHGLIEACLEHFGRPGTIERRDICRAGESMAEFQITLAASIMGRE